MTHLFDTNAWIRVVLAPDELSASTRQLLADPEVIPCGLSAISIFEVTLKVRKGKIDLRMPTDQWIALALRRSLVTVIPVDAEIAYAANSLPETFHQDPADRLITATARLRNLTVITSDQNILRYPHVQSFDSR